MLQNRYTGPRRFRNIQGRAIAAEYFHRRPLRQNWEWRRRVRTEFFRRVHYLATHDRKNRFNAFDFVLRHAEIIFSEGGEIRQLACCNRSLLSALVREPTAALSIQSQRFLTAQTVCLRIHGEATKRLASDQPIQ